MKIIKNKIAAISIILSLCYLGCANIINLEGGIRDVVPPKVDSLHSSGNFQTNFQKQNIELTFNEWIKFDDPSQVIISPPLEYKPSITLKGKTIKFKFDEKEHLKPDATYTLNFGESIKDITEGNKSKFRFVFSTGARIDSNTVQFKVVDVKKNEPQENILVMMYDNLSDSVVSLEKPLYFAKTDQTGTCRIENVKLGKFKVFALMDANLNFKYDLTSEKTGFLASPLEVKKDSTGVININLFDPDLKIRIKEKFSSNFGLEKIVFSKSASFVKPEIEDVGQKTLLEYEQDTLRLWHDQTTDTKWKLVVLKDTIQIKPNNKPEILTKNRLELLTARKSQKRLGTDKNPGLPENINPYFPLTWNFNHPVVSIDSSLIAIKDDTTNLSLKRLILTTDSLSPRKIKISGPWKENHNYTITALPGAFSDFYGLRNDTIVQVIHIEPAKKFGEINAKILNLGTGNAYIIYLQNQVGAITEMRKLTGKQDVLLNFKSLSPSIYEIKIIEDQNKNGIWDSGNYYEGRQAEKAMVKKLEELKPNWTMETEINFQ
ncbi:MAG: Ig-like domain-containing protein [Saprospiraceae bacterium]